MYIAAIRSLVYISLDHNFDVELFRKCGSKLDTIT